MQIWIDADACPAVVKEIVFRAAERLEIPTILVANRLLRTYGRGVGLDPSFTVMDQGDALEMFGIVRAGVVETAGPRFPKKETIAAVYDQVVGTQRPLGDVVRAEFPWVVGHLEALPPIFEEYTRRKRARRVLDYADLLLFWRGMLASREIGDEVAARFDHVLVVFGLEHLDLQQPPSAQFCGHLATGEHRHLADGDAGHHVQDHAAATAGQVAGGGVGEVAVGVLAVVALDHAADHVARALQAGVLEDRPQLGEAAERVAGATAGATGLLGEALGAGPACALGHVGGELLGRLGADAGPQAQQADPAEGVLRVLAGAQVGADVLDVGLLEEAQARGLLEFGRDEKSGAYVYRSHGGSSAPAAPARAEGTNERTSQGAATRHDFHAVATAPDLRSEGGEGQGAPGRSRQVIGAIA